MGKTRLRCEDMEFILDTVSDAVFTVDREFVVTSFNHAAEINTGLRREDVIGRHCYDVLHKTICDYVAECPMAQIFDGRGGAIAREVDIVHALQPGASLRVSVHLLRDPDGAIVGGVESFRPFTVGDALSISRDAAPRRVTHANEMAILEASERRVIEEVLRRVGWNRVRASRELGISRTTLWRKMRRLNIPSRLPRSP